MNVVELITAEQTYGWRPEDLACPLSHVTLGQMHSALAYCSDHQAATARELARDLAMVDDVRRRVHARHCSTA